MFQNVAQYCSYTPVDLYLNSSEIQTCIDPFWINTVYFSGDCGNSFIFKHNVDEQLHIFVYVLKVFHLYFLFLRNLNSACSKNSNAQRNYVKKDG